MADKAKRKAILYLLLAAIGFVLCMLYLHALIVCPKELLLSYVGLSALCALQACSGVALATLTLRRREGSRFGKIITALFALTSIPTTVVAALWALRLVLSI